MTTHPHLEGLHRLADEFDNGSVNGRMQANKLRQALAALPGGGVDEAEAQRKFTEYFVKNYPGPDTIINAPHWHAPRIFRAACNALRSAEMDTPSPPAGEVA